MPRKKKTVAQLFQELTGQKYFTVYNAADDKPMRWQWLDYPLMQFGLVLEFTGLPKGRIESYSRRGLWDLEYHGDRPGSGRHVLYSPRSVLKLIAIDRLAEAGAWPECLRSNFDKNRQFDLILNGYQCRSYTDDTDPNYNDPNDDRTLFLNDASWRYFREHGRFPPPASGDPWYQSGPAPDDWLSLQFNVAAFVKDIIPRLIRFFAEKDVQLSYK